MPRFGGAPKCGKCQKSAYPQESEVYDGTVYHKTCFKCKECKRGLTTINIAAIKGELYCKVCFMKIFKSRGKYDDFGVGIAQQGEHKQLSPEEAKRKKFEDSNVAKIGTKADKDLRKHAAGFEPAWENAGTKVGLEIWRIEKFKVKAWPKAEYGRFFEGDSYIVMNTYRKPDEEALSFDLHFWLGTHTTQDEAGTCAYKTVELDDFLDQKPVQYREVQGHESDAFLGLFPKGIHLMAGGVESGFNKVKPEEYKPRLMHCKGKVNRVRVTQVDLSVASLNHGDSFILDNGLTLFQWNGRSAAVSEKNKARDVRLGLNDQRNGRCKSIILDGCEDEPDFWKLLGADATPADGDIAPPGADDEKEEPFEKVALQVSDDSGELKCTEIARGAAINRQIFGSTDAYILDIGSTIYVFVGVNASKQEKSGAMKFATDYMEQNGRPMYTPVSRVLEGGATIAFNKACNP